MFRQLPIAPCRRKPFIPASTPLTLITLLASRFPSTMTQRRRHSRPASPETAPTTSTRGLLRRRRVVLTFGSAQGRHRLQRTGSSGRNTVLAGINRLLGTSLHRLPSHSLARLNRVERANSRETLWPTSGRKRLDLTSLSLRSQVGRQHRPHDPSGRSRRHGLFG